MHCRRLSLTWALVTCVALAAGAAAAQPAASAPPAGNDLAARRAALNTLLDEQWQYNLKNSPEFASVLGDKRYNDRWTDQSPAAIEADIAMARSFLSRFEAIDTTGFP